MSDRLRETASARAGRLYDELGTGLYRYAVMLLADAVAAEDAIQQVFAALLRQKDPIENEPHYLRRAVRNECYSLLRGRARKKEEEMRPLLEPVATEGVNHAERLALEARTLPPRTCGRVAGESGRPRS
jgi:DNA-directed RNA polymerase specialized sigma24 family protein